MEKVKALCEQGRVMGVLAWNTSRKISAAQAVVPRPEQQSEPGAGWRVTRGDTALHAIPHPVAVTEAWEWKVTKATLDLLVVSGEGAAAGPTQQLRAVTVHHQDMVPGAVITGINVQGREGDENPLVVRDSDSVGMVGVGPVVAGVVGGLEDASGWSSTPQPPQQFTRMLHRSMVER